MSKEFTKDQIIIEKKAAIRRINNYLEGCISKDDVNVQKKAYLLSSWLQKYIKWISFENEFDPTFNIHYKRGNVVKLDFGFNVGSEFGGTHYAIVLDKNNKHSSNTLTVVPLSSVKSDKKVYERDVLLGNELYSMLHAKYSDSFSHLQLLQSNAQKIIELTNLLLASVDDAQKNTEITELRTSALNTITDVETRMKSLTALGTEISYMKSGSIAKIEHITTISKMRIWIPQKKSDVLYGISYSENSMKRINDKIKELYIFEE